MPRPASPSSMTDGAAAISIVFKGSGLLSLFKFHADVVYLALLDADGNLDKDHLVAADYFDGQYVYLLNAQPGRYAPIATSYNFFRARYWTSFDEATAKSWSVEVKGGEIAFMGDFYFTPAQIGTGIAGNLASQAAGLLPPFKRHKIHIEFSSPYRDIGVSAEGRAMRAIMKSLAGLQWSEYARARFEALGNPPEEIMVGFLRKKPAPRLQADHFSYIDLLQWGQPIKTAMGLEWRQPQDRARIAVNFSASGTEGYKPREGYLTDMRAAGSPEDSHMIRDIILSSRTAHAATYTTYYYPPSNLVGHEPEVYRTETILIAAGDDYHLVRYRARREYFSRYYPVFRHFIQYLDFPLKKERKK